MTDERAEIERHLPGLRSRPWQKTSEPTDRYNCLAHAIGDASRWWWPGGTPEPSPGEDYWPTPGASDERLEDFLEPFRHQGFERSSTSAPEAGVEKVAFYVDASGLVQHAARQIPDGRWSSKLGQLADIAHDLADLEGEDYGRATVILQRKLSGG